MKFQEGEKLVCSSKECRTELIINETCNCNENGSECDVEAHCCGQPMVKESSKSKLDNPEFQI